MMETFKIIEDDISFDGQNNIEIVSGQDEEVQSIERALTTNIEEWFLNAEHGFDYSVIQRKAVDEEQIRLALIEVILQEDRVSEVEEITIDLNRQTRNMTIGFKAKMKSGGAIQEVVSIG